MILERLGVLSDEVSPTLTEALDWAAAQGLKHVEIRMVDGVNVSLLTDEQVDRVRTEVERRGLFISAVASPLYKCALDPSRPVADGDRFGQKEESVEEHHNKLHRCIEIAKKLGTSNIRIFSFWREQNPERYMEEVAVELKKAAEVAESEDILLLLENEPSCNGGYIEEVAQLVRMVDSKALKALWDPGNQEYSGKQSFPAGYESAKDVIAHVHLKDALVTAEGKPHCVPIGSGNVPFIAQFRALEEDGYKGLFTIETHYIPEGGTALDGTALTLSSLIKLLKED